MFNSMCFGSEVHIQRTPPIFRLLSVFHSFLYNSGFLDLTETWRCSVLSASAIVIDVARLLASLTRPAGDGSQSSLGIRKACTLCRVEREGLASGFAVVIVARRLRTRALSIGAPVAWRLKLSTRIKVS